MVFPQNLGSTESPSSITPDLASQFDWPEYAVFASLLVVSTAIGLYYGLFGSKQKSTEDYLLGNRRMTPFPVALSLLASFISAMTFIGHPVEVYLYGTQITMVMLIYIPLTLTVAYIYVPVYFNLGLTSAYEYLELRFDISVRIVVSILALFHYVVYMAFTVYTPSLALSQVTGFDTKLSSAVIFLVCSFYSALGGMKAVLITDTLQTIVMLGSITAVTSKGIYDLGGLSSIWEKADEFGRLQFFNFDTDPRVRHSFWSATIGSYFSWLTSYTTQSMVQRYLSMKSISSVRKALFINTIGLFIVQIFVLLTGLILIAKYHDCDPVSIGLVSSSDQLFPYFVMDTLRDIPGLPGLFVAGITSASLSSVSSGVNALAAILTHDYLKRYKPGFSDAKLAKFSKVMSFLVGLVSFLFIFAIERMGNILPAASGLVGMIVGPVCGIFTLGFLFPFANAMGSLLGMGISFILMIFIVISTNVANNRGLLPDQRLPLSTDGCTNGNSTLLSQTLNSWKDYDDSPFIKFLSMSYQYYPTIAILSTISFGLIFSAIFRFWSAKNCSRVKSNLISPPFLKIWRFVLTDYYSNWIEDIK